MASRASSLSHWLTRTCT